VILCRADRRSIGGELNKSESPVTVRMRKINSSRSRPIVSSHKIVRELIDKGRTWVKVSGAYSNSKIGPPSYPEATKIARIVLAQRRTSFFAAR
jgi:hypothetical protein